MGAAQDGTNPRRRTTISTTVAQVDHGAHKEMGMGLFGKLVATAINVATIPVAVTKDVFTLGGVATEQREPYIVQKLKQIKDEAK